jgi:hypothetical protein
VVLTPSRQANRPAGNIKSFVYMYLSLLLTQYSHRLLIGCRFTENNELNWGREDVINSMLRAILNSLQGRARMILPYIPSGLAR